MFLRYGNARDYYSLCGFMNLTLWNLWEFVCACRGSSIKLAWSERVCVCVCPCVFARACVVRTFTDFLKLKSPKPPSAAASVQRLSMERLLERIIAASSASVPVWNSQISRLFQLQRQTIKLLSSGSANKHKLWKNKGPEMYISQQKRLRLRLMGLSWRPCSQQCSDIQPFRLQISKRSGLQISSRTLCGDSFKGSNSIAVSRTCMKVSC